MGDIGFMSTLGRRLQLALRAGLQFGGARDLYKVYGYKSALRFDDFLAKYTRQDIARRIVDAFPDSTWGDGLSLMSDNAEFISAWENLEPKTTLFPALHKADRLCGLGRFSVILFGLDDEQTLDKPVRITPGKPPKLLYIQPYSERAVSVQKFNEDTQSDRYGLPEFYKIQPGQEASNAVDSRPYPSRVSITVHHSRIAHIAEGSFEDSLFGLPRLEPIYNLLDDLLKVSGGSAETFWLTSNRGLHADIDKNMDLDEKDAKDLSDEIDEYQHQLRRVIRTRGVKIESLGSDVPDPTGTFSLILSLISASTGIPQKILTGSETGSLASAQDRANWADRIDHRRSTFASPVVLFPLIDKFVSFGLLPVRPKDLLVKWPDAFKLSPLERAQTSAQMARSAVNTTRALTEAKKNEIDPIVNADEARAIVGITRIKNELAESKATDATKNLS